MPHRSPVRVAWIATVLALTFALPKAQAQEAEVAPADRAAIEGLIDDWYADQCAGEDGRPYRLLAPGAIDASPGYRHINTESAALGPRSYFSLAATATVFRYEITRLRADRRFARVQVRERGYTYAPAAERTYERMGDAVLVVERQDDGRWLVLAHRTNPTGFPPSLAADPLPDLSPNGSTPEPRCGRYRPGEHAG